MIAFAIAAAALVAAQSIEVEPGTPPEVASAFETWARCILDGVEADTGQGSVQRASAALVATCRPHQERLSAAHGRWVDAQPMAETAKNDARRSMARSVAHLRGQVARMIRMQRED